MFVFFSNIATPRHQIILPYPANNRVIKHSKYVVIDIKLIHRTQIIHPGIKFLHYHIYVIMSGKPIIYHNPKIFTIIHPLNSIFLNNNLVW